MTWKIRNHHPDKRYEIPENPLKKNGKLIG